MRNNLVPAAAVAGLAAILACVVLIVGVHWALVDAADRLGSAVDRLNTTMATHANSIEKAGNAIASPQVKLVGPVSIADDQPIRIRGPHSDGSLPVGVTIEGKGK